MKTQSEKNKLKLAAVLALSFTIILALSLGRVTLRNQLEKEKIRAESLLSEKLKLDKTIQTFRKELIDMGHKNVRLDEIVAATKQQLRQKKLEINRLMKENATVTDLRRKLTELEALKEQFNQQMAEMKTLLATLQKENNQLNTQLASAQNQNDILTINNAILRAMAADNYRIEALKGRNEKLTISARRTDKLLVIFDLPSDIGSDIYFKVINPEGKEYSSKTDLSASIKITEKKGKLLASISNNLVNETSTKHVELEFKPKDKLVKGIYKFHVYNGDNYLGSTQMRLK